MPASPRSSRSRSWCSCTSPRLARPRRCVAAPTRRANASRSSRPSLRVSPTRSPRCRPRSRSAPSALARRPRMPASPRRPRAWSARPRICHPAAPAGVGAPALAAATRLIPDPVFAQPMASPVGLVDRPADDATSVDPPPVPSGGNGSSHRPLAASAATMQRAVGTRPGGPSRPAGGPPRGGQGRPPGGQGRAGGAQGRPSGPPRGTMAMRPGPRRTRTGTVLAVLGGLLLVGAVVAGVLVIKNINHGSSASKSSAAAAARSARSKPAVPVRRRGSTRPR